MKTFINKIVLIAIPSFLLLSCTDNFQDINTDPNRPKKITPGVMLGQMQYKMVNTTINSAYSFGHELMQYTAPRNSTSGGVHRYILQPSTATSLWNNLYSQLTDVEDMYNISSQLGEDNYKAISLIYKSWSYSILTDCFGDIPYSQASKATEGVLTPAFDAQKDIYTNILADLDRANSLLNSSKALTYGGDILYSANSLSGANNPGITKWKKFCNSLRLRLLLRISKRNAEINVNEQINSILANPDKYPIFTSNADEAILKYPNTLPYYNPYFNARQSDWRADNSYTRFFINKLNADSDPRRTVWAYTVKVGDQQVYQGIESGYPGSQQNIPEGNSGYNDGLKSLPQLGIMMSYAELQFILAELALKGFNTGNTAKNHYNAGITASMIQWGVTLPTGYLAKEGIAYDEAATPEKQLEQIMLQKWLALFFTDLQAWYEKRRTGLPAMPRGSGIPAQNTFPSRALYPTYLQSLNNDNLQKVLQTMGGDQTTVKVWWDK
ncbi:SusD/RagB family nutrient-binding outer membrane lipoprotein [Desertivirga arenae]|uniref:SusD/RagB family nutrient-binding outer membrane lipoprotein n=1 Tax=Desertivirga arenae TaxID=2810309 RepID=UPI001F609BA1|nr:SusD/RagB family nutrient-binding outer membrane lipoprotein [Pedobacter sp. SYSU D00823]